jgi:hypothetical protein
MKAPGEKFIVCMTALIGAFVLALRHSLTTEFSVVVGSIVAVFNAANAYITGATKAPQQ